MFGGYFAQQPFGGSFITTTPPPPPVVAGDSETLYVHLDANVAATGTATQNRDVVMAFANRDAVMAFRPTDATFTLLVTDATNFHWRVSP